MLGALITNPADTDHDEIDHAVAGVRRRRSGGAGAMTSGVGLKRPAGEVLVLVAAGLGVAASVLPSVVGTIASLGPGRSLSLDAGSDGAWAWSVTVLRGGALSRVRIARCWVGCAPSS